MSYAKDPRVDDYIDPLPDWQQAICREVRDLVHAADPEVVETIKRTMQPYFVLDGNICALQAAKDHVNVFLYDGGPSPTRTASSPAVTTTRQRAQSPSTRASGSTVRHSRRCSGRSSPTTAPAAGASSSATHRIGRAALALHQSQLSLDRCEEPVVDRHVASSRASSSMIRPIPRTIASRPTASGASNRSSSTSASWTTRASAASAGIGQAVMLEQHLERAVGPVVAERMAGDVERRGVRRQAGRIVDEQKRRVGIDVAADQPGARGAVHVAVDAGHPVHAGTSSMRQLFDGVARRSAGRGPEVVARADPAERPAQSSERPPSLGGIGRSSGLPPRAGWPGTPRRRPDASAPPARRSRPRELGRASQTDAEPWFSRMPAASHSRCSRLRGEFGSTTSPSATSTVPSRRSARHSAIRGADGSRGNR